MIDLLCRYLHSVLPVILFTGILPFSSGQSQEPNAPAVIDASDIVLSPVPVDQKKHPIVRSAIVKRIDTLIGDKTKTWCAEAGVTWPPSCILFRTFKKEGEYEIWAGGNSGPLKLVKVVRICSFDNNPGPKLKQGDGKTPEGFYSSGELYGSTLWFMWMGLSPETIDGPGTPNDGSSFRLCIDYPNAADRNRTRRLGLGNPGGEICIHGNCVSAGCISFRNKVFLFVYYFAAMHNSTENGPLQVHIFPFRFTEKLKEEHKGAGGRRMGEKEMLEFWGNIEEGYARFNETRRPIQYRCVKDRYEFVK